MGTSNGNMTPQLAGEVYDYAPPFVLGDTGSRSVEGRSEEEVQHKMFDHLVDKSIKILESLTQCKWIEQKNLGNNHPRSVKLLCLDGKSRLNDMTLVESTYDDSEGMEWRRTRTEPDGTIIEETWPYDLSFEALGLKAIASASNTHGADYIKSDPLAWLRLGKSVVFDPVLRELRWFSDELRKNGLNPIDVDRIPEIYKSGENGDFGVMAPTIQNNATVTARKILNAWEDAVVNSWNLDGTSESNDKFFNCNSNSPFLHLIDLELKTAFVYTFKLDDAALEKTRYERAADYIEDEIFKAFHILDVAGIDSNGFAKAGLNVESIIGEEPEVAADSGYVSPSTPQDLNRLIRTLNGLKYSSPANKRYPSVVLDSVFEDAREYIKEEHDRALESVIALLCGVYAMTFDDLDEGLESVGDVLWVMDSAYGIHGR